MTATSTLTQINTTQALLGISKPVEVILVGAGGTGSAVLSMLFQLHTTLVKLGGNGLNITVYDPKRVTAPNVGRQGFWSDGDVGHYKASLLVNRFNQFGEVNWKAVCGKYDSNAKACDLVITTVDSASARIDIGKILNQIGRKDSYWLDLGNAKEVGQCVIGSQQDGDGINTLPSPYQLFGTQWATIDESKISAPSCSTQEAISKQSFGVNQTLATLSISMVLYPLMRTGSLENFGFMFNLKTMETFPFKVDKNVWAMYGFSPEVEAA
ncbi:PRTRC system ThiF family protein [Vibrio rotiferianus]